MTYETVTLINGPAHGTEMSWDGGNYIEVVEKPSTKVLPMATSALRELMVKKHTYRRDDIDRSRFIWQGELL